MSNLDYYTGRLSLFSVAELLQSLCHICRSVREYKGEGPDSEEQQVFGQWLVDLSAVVRNRYTETGTDEERARALLALMDAYEIVPDKENLQFALPAAEKLLTALEDSPLKCKLLSYCYYYTEAPVCASEAHRILAGWDRTCYTAEMAEAAACYEALV